MVCHFLVVVGAKIPDVDTGDSYEGLPMKHAAQDPGRVCVEDDALDLSRNGPGEGYFLRPKSGIDNCSPPLSADWCATIPGAV